MKRVLAFDFGASSGRAILAEYDGGALTYKEVHRFENCPRESEGHFRWDFNDLMANVRLGIEKAGAFDSIAFDTWGVDFGLLGEDGTLLGDPVHYRDGRTEGMTDKAFRTMDAGALYAATGSQIMPINTLFQLLAVKESDPETWSRAKRLLFMPDLFAHALCGADACETTIASTSQMLDARTGAWSRSVLDTFGIPETLFAPLVKSGTVVGEYRGAKVVAAAGHDTQCAVAALPAPDKDAAFLSCGTWSLLGCELDAPVLTDESRRLELSNERGANGKVNYLKNIIGLWLIQESRRQWRREGQEYSYAELEQLALAAEPLRSFIDPDAPEFTRPGMSPHRAARARDRRRGDALHLREPRAQVPLRARPALRGHRQALFGAARPRRRHEGRSSLPHDGGLHRPSRPRGARRGDSARQHRAAAHRAGRTPGRGRGPCAHRAHRSRQALRTGRAECMEQSIRNV